MCLVPPRYRGASQPQPCPENSAAGTRGSTQVPLSVWVSLWRPVLHVRVGRRGQGLPPGTRTAPASRPEPLLLTEAGLFLRMELSKVPLGAHTTQATLLPVTSVEHPSPVSHVCCLQALVLAGECPPAPGLCHARGSPHTYLLALLDVVVLPDIGAPDEHDFELLLMPTMDKRGEVLHQLMGENSSSLWGARAHLGEAAGLFLPATPSVFEVCPLHSHPRVPVHV